MTENNYLPIQDYGIVGDTKSAALIAKDGSIDWLCWPDFDSPALFCRLLDINTGGSFRIHPTGAFKSSQSYIHDTNVLETTFETGTGRVRLVDFMPMSETRHIGNGRSMFRLVEGLSGSVEMQVCFRPTFDFGRGTTHYEQITDGWVARSNNEVACLKWHGKLTRGNKGELSATITINPSARAWLELSYDMDSTVQESGGANHHPEKALQQTIAYWHRWLRTCTYSGTYNDLVRRSALVLKLLMFSPTGAVVAAPTTSLPEDPGGVRNWDYRYTWLRDSALIIYALQLIGYHKEAAEFLEWLNRLEIAEKGHVGVVYSIHGEDTLVESQLDNLEGYRGSRPVRIGNSAYQQEQFDVYGEVLDAAFLYHERVHKRLPQKWWDEVGFLADEAARCWLLPDNGIWEFRAEKKHFLYSKLLCWVALDRAIKLGIHRKDKKRFNHWVETRSNIQQCLLTRGYNKSVGAFTQSLDDTELDATALMIPVVGFLPGTDDRVKSTVKQIQEKLTRHGLVYRYAIDDGLPGSESSFGICSYWMVDNLALAGRVEEAHQLFKHLADYASPLKLFSEQIDPQNGDLVGNYPQGFSHLALIRSAFHIEETESLGTEEIAHDPAQRARRMEQAGRLPEVPADSGDEKG